MIMLKFIAVLFFMELTFTYANTIAALQSSEVIAACSCVAKCRQNIVQNGNDNFTRQRKRPINHEKINYITSRNERNFDKTKKRNLVNGVK